MEHIRSHIAAIALGLLLLLIGHDAVMATDPHSTADDGHHGIESAVPDSNSDCGLTIGARSQSSHVLDFDDLPAAQRVPPEVDRAVGFSRGWSVEPDHPPETRRALLQVYLN